MSICTDDLEKIKKIINWMYFKFFRDHPNVRDNSSWFAYLKRHGISTNGEFPLNSDIFWVTFKNDNFVIVEQPGFGARWAAIPVSYARQILEFEEKIYVLGGLP